MNTNKNEGSDFLYENDFETVDDSEKEETIYLKVSYRGKLPAQTEQGADCAYADDFDVAEDTSFEKQIMRHMVDHFNVPKEKALVMVSKYIGDINVEENIVQQLGPDYFAIQILMQEKIIPYQPL